MPARDAARLLRAWDRWELALRSTPFGLLAEAHPDSLVRAVAESCQLAIDRYRDSVFASPAPARALRRARAHDAVDSAARASLLEDFEESGATLPPRARRRARELGIRIAELEQAFARTLRENTTRVAFREEELKGLPASLLAGMARDAQGRVLVGFGKPEREAMQQKCEVGESRRAYLVASQRLGGEANVRRIDTLAALRAELAVLHGARSWNEWSLARRMAGSRGRVETLLDGFRTRGDSIRDREYALLRDWKRRETGDPRAVLEAWDVGFYFNRIRERCFRLDEEDVRARFPAEATTRWMMDVAGRTFGLRFERDSGLRGWAPGVEAWSVRDRGDGSRLGTVFTDLFPRPGKYRHNAEFGLVPGSAASGLRPSVALVANLDPRGFNRRELRSLFHEFGHVLHAVLSSGRYATNSGIDRVRLDFVETPSQVFEAWSRSPETVALLTASCPACAPVPAGMLERVRILELLGRGDALSSMVDLSEFDLRMHDERPGPALEVWNGLQEKRPFGPLPGSLFPGTFGHLAGGYASGYYGYLWSVVMARDVVSAFGGDLLDTAVGARLRRTVLELGSDAPPDALLRSFLGRATDDRALLAELADAQVRIDSIAKECAATDSVQ